MQLENKPAIKESSIKTVNKKLSVLDKLRNDNEAEIYKKAKMYWLLKNRHLQANLSQKLDILTSKVNSNDQQTNLNLRQVRQLQQLSLESVANKLKKSRAAVSKLEASQIKGTISLNHLKELSETLGYELQIALIPKANEYEDIFKLLWLKSKNSKLLETIPSFKSELAIKNQMAQIIANEADILFQKPQFRQKMGWSKRKNKI